MSDFQNYFSGHAFGFWLALVLLLAAAVVWLVIVSFRQRRLRSRFEDALGAVETGSVPAMLTQYLGRTQSGPTDKQK